MVNRLVLAAFLVSGCAIRASSAHDATLPYHPTLDELRTAPPFIPANGSSTDPAGAAERFPPQIEFLSLTSAYPQPIGLDYNDDGAFRSVVGVEWDAKEFDDALQVALPAEPANGDRSRLHADGAIVSLAVYRFNTEIYVQAMLELRVARDGAEVYAARYSARLRGTERGSLLVALAQQLVRQILRDGRLSATLTQEPA